MNWIYHSAPCEELFPDVTTHLCSRSSLPFAHVSLVDTCFTVVSELVCSFMPVIFSSLNCGADCVRGQGVCVCVDREGRWGGGGGCLWPQCSQGFVPLPEWLCGPRAMEHLTRVISSKRGTGHKLWPISAVPPVDAHRVNTHRHTHRIHCKSMNNSLKIGNQIEID